MESHKDTCIAEEGNMRPVVSGQMLCIATSRGCHAADTMASTLLQYLFGWNFYTLRWLGQSSGLQ